MRRSRTTALILIVALAACSGSERTPPPDSAVGQTSGATSATVKVGETSGFDVPESVRYDEELDVYYVSNINGNPSQKDNNGYIARVRADSTSVMTRLVEGGRAGVTLHAPKGMALRGDTIFVADIDVLRMFNRRTGASLGSVDFRAQNATFLNDVAVGPDGIYVTDTGIAFDAQGAMSHPGVNRIFRVVGRRVTVMAQGDSLSNPNGIAWDAANSRFVLAPFGSQSVQAWVAGQAHPTALVSGPGGYDGVEVLANGNLLVSSWADSTVHIVHGGTHMMPMVRGVEAPADIGVDTRRNLVAVPLFNGGRVEYYRIQ
ncbi:MAG: SMP-30/gluconolactonase/LRE family protein [Gemmatimonadaceae bacterium]